MSEGRARYRCWIFPELECGIEAEEVPLEARLRRITVRRRAM
jgi:hypothetical protein